MSMKLVTIPASPFGRIVRVVIAGKGLGDVVVIEHDNPWKPDTRVPEINPAGKVPVLVLEDGTILYDSIVISEYLDAYDGRPTLFPAVGEARWIALRRAKLADHLLDAFIAIRLENNRAEGERSKSWTQRQREVVRRCLDAMESEASDLAGELTIGHVAIGVALGHLEFRRTVNDPDWREGRLELQTWYEEFAARSYMYTTLPHD